MYAILLIILSETLWFLASVEHHWYDSLLKTNLLISVCARINLSPYVVFRKALRGFCLMVGLPVHFVIQILYY